MFRFILVQIALFLTLAGAAQAAPGLELAQVGSSGDTVSLQVTYVKDQGTETVALAGDLGFDGAAFLQPSVGAGPAAVAAGKGISVSFPAPGLVRFALVGFNSAAFDGGVVAVVNFKRKPGGAPAATGFSFTGSAANRAGNEVPVAAVVRTDTLQ